MRHVGADADEGFQILAVRQREIQEHQFNVAPVQPRQPLGQLPGGFQIERGRAGTGKQVIDKFDVNRIVFDQQHANVRGRVGHVDSSGTAALPIRRLKSGVSRFSSFSNSA